jgi:hypothetical protein
MQLHHATKPSEPGLCDSLREKREFPPGTPAAARRADRDFDFWRLLATLSTGFGLDKPDLMPSAAVYGTEGQRFESSRVAVQLQGASEVDGVVAAQSVLSGEITGVAGQWFVDRDGAQLGLEILERGDRADVRRFADTASAGSRGERCACLGVDELARDQDVGAIPELDGELGAGFVEDHLTSADVSK